MINEYIQRNYKATVLRGLISSKTTKYDFFNKIDEELNEAIEASNEFKYKPGDHEIEEVIDIIMVCFAYLIHFKIDILKWFLFVVLKNEKRAKNGK